MDRDEVESILEQTEGLISDMESVLMDIDVEDGCYSNLDDALDGLKDAERALRWALQ